MARQYLKIAAVLMALVFAVCTMTACSTIQKGAEVVGSFLRGDSASGGKASGGKDGGEGKKDGLFGKAEETPEPTPPPSPKERFAADLKTVLDDTVDSAEKLESMQLMLLFDPQAKVDENKSAKTTFSIDLTNEAETDPSQRTVTITVESANDAASGDASFMMSAGAGEEDAATGGVYFIGGDMLVRRGDTSKKMIRYPLSAEQAESYKELSAIDRMTRVFGGGTGARKDTADWDKSIADYVAVFSDNSADEDYKEGSESLSVLGKAQDCPSVSLSTKGEKARTLLRGLLELMKQDDTLANLMENSSDSDEENKNSLEKSLSDLDALSGNDLDELEFNIMIYSYEDAPIGVAIKSVMKGETTQMRFQSYEKGFERDIAMDIKTKEGNTVSLSSYNVNTGGDNYEGAAKMSASEDGQPTMEMSATSAGTNDGTNIASKVDYTLTSYTEEDGTRTSQDMKGTFDVSQTKDASGAVTASGKGSLEIPIGDEPTKLTIAFKLEQVFENVTVDAPKFIASAGVVVNSQEELLKELGIDKDEYKSKSFMEAALSAMVVLLN